MDILHASSSAVPGVPQMISVAEIVQPRDDVCIILVTWDPPANSDPSDVDQYIVYVPSRNIRNNVSSSTSMNLTLPNCGDDIRIQVAAVNRIDCMGMNSSEVSLDITTAPATSEGGSASTSSKHLKLLPIFNLCLAFTENYHAGLDSILNIILPPIPFRKFLDEGLEANVDRACSQLFQS